MLWSNEESNTTNDSSAKRFGVIFIALFCENVFYTITFHVCFLPLFPMLQPIVQMHLLQMSLPLVYEQPAHAMPPRFAHDHSTFGLMKSRLFATTRVAHLAAAGSSEDNHVLTGV